MEGSWGLGNFLGSPRQRSLLDGFWEWGTLKEVTFLEVDTNAGGRSRNYLGKQVNARNRRLPDFWYFLVKFKKALYF